MRHGGRRPGTLLGAALLALALGGDAAAQSVKVGEKVPNHTFSTPLENMNGRMSMEALRGRVVVVDFWGYH